MPWLGRRGQARLTSAELLAITAWRPPVTYGYPVDYSDVDFESEARKNLEQIVEEVLGTEPSVPMVTRVAEGHPAQVLVDAAEGASMLVVGSRGLGAFAGMLLGFDQPALRPACADICGCHSAPPGGSSLSA
jgi:nucleotide-binding universal stress UspA family protein